VYIAAMVFFVCLFFLVAISLLAIVLDDETFNVNQRAHRSMLAENQLTWLRQRPKEGGVSTLTMDTPVNHTSSTTTAATTTTTTATATPKAVWKNDYNVVHVIQTRLFQFQPDLLAIGQARLEIFKAFTVPSLRNQTTNDFLWIVRTDPALHPTLKSGLLVAVQDFGNVLVVASNFNPEGFRSDDSIANITNDQDTIWAGSWDLLQSYHDAAQSRVVVESRLDADDALSKDFCQSVQEQAIEQLKDDDEAWSVGCAEYHVEWQQYSPWNETAKGRGALLGLATKHCVTPGLTFAYARAALRSDINASSHEKIHSAVPKCSHDQPTKCLYRLSVPDKMPVAFRARTTTSAGMNDLFLEDGREPTSGQAHLRSLRKSKWKTMQDTLWKALPPTCGLDAEDIWKVQAYLKEHEKEIASDALEGQCTKGHSCKEGSRAALKNLLETS
jgi:hypothetical protein